MQEEYLSRNENRRQATIGWDKWVVFYYKNAVEKDIYSRFLGLEYLK